MLTYQRTNSLDVVGYSDVGFKGCVDDKKSTIGYIFVMVGGAVLVECQAICDNILDYGGRICGML